MHAPSVQDPEQKRTSWRSGRPWTRVARVWGLAAAVPAIGLLELLAHCVQVGSAVPEADWKAARAYVAEHAKGEDLIAFVPRWADPLGRRYFGAQLATLDREARPDETRFPRAFEVSIRGAHLAALSRWKRTDRQAFGRVVVSTLENPAPAAVLSDLVSLLDAEHLHVSIGQGVGEAECPFVANAPAQTGGLGAGLPVGGRRFICPGGAPVSTTIATDLDYYPHRCIYAFPPGGNHLRLRFGPVSFGQKLHGHHAAYIETESSPQGLPVTLTFKADESVVGQVTHRDGDGWKGFEFDTSALAGRRGDLVAEITSAGGGRGGYCFEADTR